MSIVSNEKTLGLHPLAIASICDHTTRVLVGGAKQHRSKPALGLLFGITNETVSNLEIVDAVDLPSSSNLDDNSLNIEEITRKIRLLTQVYPKYQLLGWYTTGNQILSSHIVEHKKLYQFCSNPIFLLMNPTVTNDITQLPILLFTLNFDNNFTEISYVLATNKSEEISIDSITKQASTMTTGITRLELQSKGMITSLQVLQEHLNIVIEKLLTMSEQDHDSIDHQTLRMAGQLINQLEMLSNDSNMNTNTSSMITTYLGSLTKGMIDFHYLIDAVSVTDSDKASIHM